jgi:hypothetical protein
LIFTKDLCVSEKPKKQEGKLNKPVNETAGKGKRAPKALKAQKTPLIVSNTEEGAISIFLWVLLFVVVVGCGSYATKSLWGPYVINYWPQLKSMAGGQPPEDLLMDRIDQLEEEIVQVRKSGEAIADLESARGRLNKTFEGVMARILELEKKIDNVRGMKKATTPPTDAVSTNETLQRLNSRMNELEKSDEKARDVMERLNNLEQGVAERGFSVSSSAEELSQIMTDISQRIGTLESGTAQSVSRGANVTVAKQKARAQTLVLAVGHLRETLRSSDPFVQSLKALKVLGSDDPDIMRGLKELAPFAQTGILTIDMLRRDYDAVAKKIRAAAPKVASGEMAKSALGKAIDQVTSLVSIRKMGSEGTERIAISPVDTAMVQLDQDNLGGAIATLSALYGPEAAAAAPWLVKAQGRLIAETTLSKLHVVVISILATAIQ